MKGGFHQLIKSPVILFFWASVFFLLFFRPGIALRITGDFDESCYIQQTAKFLNVSPDGCVGKDHLPGVSLVWLPFAFLGKVLAAFLGQAPMDWIAAFCGLASFLFWLGSLKILFELNKMTHPHSPARAFLILLNIPVLYFAFARNLMAHSAELFLALLFLLLLLREKLLGAGIAMILLLATRINNVGILLFYLAYIWENPKKNLSSRLRNFLPVLALLFATFFVTTAFLYFGMWKGYHGTFLIPLILDWEFENFLWILFRSDHGIVWNQPAWSFLFFFSFLYVRKFSALQLSAFFWMLLSFLIASFWPTYGSSFGYRYLIGAYAPAIYLFFNGPWEKSLLFRWIALFLMGSGALWGIHLYWTSTAPPPLWPWQDPFYKGLAPPYSQALNWFKYPREMWAMGKFSALGEFISTLQNKEVFLNFKGEKIAYFFEGPLRSFIRLLNFSAGLTLIFSVFFILKKKSRTLAQKP